MNTIKYLKKGEKMLKMSLLILLSLCSVAYADIESLNKATAMITNREESSGGTGVVLKSSNEKSLILTNAHVCEVVKNGGLVHTSKGKVAVERYTKSSQHDLCLVEVIENLGVNTEIANRAPKAMDKTYVAGHPFLYPTTVSEGHMSGSMIIRILVGTRACTDKEFKSNGFMCFLYGGMPLIRELNTVAVSNLIAPGNSGSAVYNDSGKLVGLIFAGAGRGMSPGIVVPYEYLKTFVDSEMKSGKLVAIEVARPKTPSELNGSDDEGSGKLISITELKTLNNLVFAAIKDSTLDKIENKVKTCIKTDERECLNLIAQ